MAMSKSTFVWECRFCENYWSFNFFRIPQGFRSSEPQSFYWFYCIVLIFSLGRWPRFPLSKDMVGNTGRATRRFKLELVRGSTATDGRQRNSLYCYHHESPKDEPHRIK
jgi:hypothetical protein